MATSPPVGSVPGMPVKISSEDQLLTVAFSLHSNPGAYALLLGAGVSASSGIPTAWGVLEDLVGRAAELRGADTDDAVHWYEEQFGHFPTYEGVLERIAPTQLERQRVLRGFFERTADDVDAGRKTPTAAHQSVARLVRAGAVRVIVTLNFDHLIEQALRAEGIEPTVIASPADIDGMAPLHTLDCCVIHLHGDYLNPASMLNTVAELGAYQPSTAQLLRRVLEDYGLIIAGWSSRYDPALRDAIAAHYPNRFTLTWFEPAPPSEEATILRTLKNGVLVSEDADTGFGRLADGVAALTSRRARHPLTIPVAVETAKRELSGRAVAIGLHDTLRTELDALHRLPEFHLADYQTHTDYRGLLGRVEEGTRLSAALIATLSYWGDARTDRWWIDELPRFATPVDGSGAVKLLSLRVIAGSMLFYAAGTAAIAAGRWELLGRLFALRRPNQYNGDYDPLAGCLDTEAGYGGSTNAHTRLFDALAPVLAETLSLGAEPQDDAWQLFEILRLSWATQADPRFGGLHDQYKSKSIALMTARNAEKAAERQPGGDTAPTRAARLEAWQEQERTLGQIAALIPVGRPHILTVDFRQEERYQSVVARRLLQDLAAERATHPIVADGVIADVSRAKLAVRAVSAALGMVGHDLSWARVRGGAGVIPSRMWLDSGLTPEEHAQEAPAATDDRIN